MKGITKFLKNKNTVTILGVLICLVILYAGYNMRINQKTKLVTVFYANQTIQPKTQITAEMISRMEVPESFIKGKYYRNYNDILGKYSNYNTMIAEGSIFYSDLLVPQASLPDAIFYNVNEGERVVSFPTGIAETYGNSIMPGNIVDIYVKLYRDEKIIYGEMFENIEVLALKDSSGKNVFENVEESRKPAYIYFSLPEAKYLLFSSLNYLIKAENTKNMKIEIVMVPNSVEFDVDNPLAVEVTSEYLYNFVLDEIEQIDDQSELYDELLNDMEQYALDKKKAKEAKEKEKTDSATVTTTPTPTPSQNNNSNNNNNSNQTNQ